MPLPGGMAERPSPARKTQNAECLARATQRGLDPYRQSHEPPLGAGVMASGDEVVSTPNVQGYWSLWRKTNPVFLGDVPKPVLVKVHLAARLPDRPSCTIKNRVA